ncbi:MAG: energy transducer TonB [Polyangiaceae bacterium]
MSIRSAPPMSGDLGTRSARSAQSEGPVRSTLPRSLAFRGWSVLLSVTFHASLVFGVAYVALHGFGRSTKQEAIVTARGPDELELPVVFEGTDPMPTPVPTGVVVPPLAGAAAAARIDNDALGKSGTPSHDPAVNLAPRAEPWTFVPDPLSDLRREQDQHVRSAPDRAAFEDRRSAREPMDLTFVATGAGADRARRVQGSAASQGAKGSSVASRMGGALGQDIEPDIGEGGKEGSSQLGSPHPSPGHGTPNGAPGAREHDEAASMKARPSVPESPPSIPANTKGLVRDNVDSDQAVASALRSIVRASTAGGTDGTGSGGSGAPGEAGFGGARGEGSHARVSGAGSADWFDLDSRDPSLLPYFRTLHARIDPLTQNAFPRAAIVELKQGYVILEIIVHRDGTARVSWPPWRPSGIPEYDANCAEAVRRAQPFPPPPANLGHGDLRIRATFRANRQW